MAAGKWAGRRDSFESWRFRGYRHGGGSVGGAAGSFKMEAAFYDGHVEPLDDLTGSNPLRHVPVGNPDADE